MSQSPAPAEADQRAAAAVVRHHAQLADALHTRADRLSAAAEQADLSQVRQSRGELVAWLQDELLPHARAEETALYPAAAARPGGALLVDGMLAEHRTIVALVDELGGAASPVRAAAAARALAAVFTVHLAKENDLVLPLLTAAEDGTLARSLEGMHELLGAH